MNPLRPELHAQTVDSTKSDSTFHDPSGIDTVITFTAKDSIEFIVPNSHMTLFGKATLDYETQKLSAETIELNWRTATLTTYGRNDSLAHPRRRIMRDTTRKDRLGAPVFRDAGTTYEGKRIDYNFRTKKGTIGYAETEIDNGFYYGEKIRRVDERTLFVQNGTYTTCDAPHPHYFFFAPKMKIITGAEVFAEPVFLYVADVPIFALPFGVFPNKSGRASGLIPPTYGQSRRKGYYLEHLGYYWAVNDYLGASATANIYAKGDLAFETKFDYAWLYHLQGKTQLNYGRTHESEEEAYTTNYRISWQHNQKILYGDFAADVSFASENYPLNTATTVNDYLRQNIHSGVTYSRSLESFGSLSLGYSRDQNILSNVTTDNVFLLQSIAGLGTLSSGLNYVHGDSTGSTTLVYPSLGMSFPTIRPFAFLAGDDNAVNFWNLFTLTYGGRYDYAGYHLREKETFNNSYTEVVTHSPSISFSPKFSYVTISPFVRYSENWYFRTITKEVNPADSSVRNVEHRDGKIHRLYNYNYGVSLSTTIYGTLQPNVFGIVGLRHVLVPSVSYTITPDFTSERYGFVKSYYNIREGAPKQYSIYELDRGNAVGKSEVVGISIGNEFQAKYSSSDSAATEKKITLANVDLSTSYNPLSPLFRWGDIGMQFRSSAISGLQFTGDATFDLYRNNEFTGARISEMRIGHGELPRLKHFSLSLSSSFAGGGEWKTIPADSLQMESDEQVFLGHYRFATPQPAFPWNVNVNYSYSFEKPEPFSSSKSSSVYASFTLQPTALWKVSATTRYEVFDHQFIMPSISVTRDLHCWELSFTWQPSGPVRGFSFELKLKAPQLSDVKLTKREGAQGYY